jgi:hypothetical protein
MTPARALGLALAAAGRAEAQSPACLSAYRADYATEWQMTAAEWTKACAKGLDGGDVLRQAQRDSIARCVARFLPHERAGKIPTGETQAYCARGADGRAHLADAAGLPRDASPAPRRPPPPRVPERKPGSAGMGPLQAALDKARAAWRPDACFSGLAYHYGPLEYSDCEEIQSAREEKRPARITVRTGRDYFNYYFSSAASERDIYRVSYHDDLRQCPDVVSLKGPDHENAPRPTGLDACLGSVSVDVGQAVEIASHNGWQVAVPMRAVLASFPKAFFARTCGKGTAAMGGTVWRNYPVACGDGGWDGPKLRRATGSPVWVLSSQGQTAFVDARTGRFRFLGDGAFDMDLPYDLGVGGMGLEVR